MQSDAAEIYLYYHLSLIYGIFFVLAKNRIYISAEGVEIERLTTIAKK